MTEAEWLACDDPDPMRAFLRGNASDRRLRLFGCACYRSVWQRVPVSQLRREVLDASEAFADGAMSKAAFKLARKRVKDWDGPRVSGEAWEVALHSSWGCLGRTIPPPGGGSAPDARPEEVWVQVDLLRDIFGNPFRTVAFDPAWRTSTVVAIAKGMYETREFSVMPILADALQDAGCDNDDVLQHCRDESQAHVRGCWVVDLVLGKE